MVDTLRIISMGIIVVDTSFTRLSLLYTLYLFGSFCVYVPLHVRFFSRLVLSRIFYEHTIDCEKKGAFMDECIDMPERTTGASGLNDLSHASF